MAVGPQARSRFDSWVDIEVAGARTDAVAICASLAGREARRVFPPGTGLAAWVVRECATAPLPQAGGRAPGAYVLVDRREASVADHLLAVLGDRCLLQRSARTRATTTNVSRFATEAACTQARDRLRAAQARGEVEAGRAAHDWLQQQLRDLEAREARACAETKAFAGLERARVRARRAVERSCAGDPQGARCTRAKQQALDLGLRELEATRHTRECANARALVKVVRARATRPQPVPSRPLPACRAE